MREQVVRGLEHGAQVNSRGRHEEESRCAARIDTHYLGSELLLSTQIHRGNLYVRKASAGHGDRDGILEFLATSNDTARGTSDNDGARKSAIDDPSYHRQIRTKMVGCKDRDEIRDLFAETGA
jgi:hypothetical protein